MTDTCTARYVVNPDADATVPTVVVQCQEGSLEFHPKHVRLGGEPELLHRAWTPDQPKVEWLDSQSMAPMPVSADPFLRDRDTPPEPEGEGEHRHECGHTDAEHAEQDGRGEGLAGLLAAIFGGRVPEGAPQPMQGTEFAVGKAPEPEQPSTEQMVGTMMQGLETMRALHRAALDSASGHRAECEAAGFAPAMAEIMAVTFYMQAIGR